MTLLLLATLAFAQEPVPAPAPAPAATTAPAPAAAAAPKAVDPSKPTDAVVQAVSAVYGKPVPAAAICVEHQPTLPAEFTGGPIAVGVMRGAAGCRITGVLVNGAWTSTAEAAKVSLGEAWAKASKTRREELLEVWTDQVLLAFDQVDPTVKIDAKPGSTGGFQVGATFWQRTDERHVAKRTAGTFYFDGDAVLETSDRDGGQAWRTGFYVQERSVEGVTIDQVMAALKQQGKTMSECVDEAWKKDHTVDGRVQLKWTIRDKAATQIAFVDEGETNEALAKCYASGLRKIVFPEGMAGTVTWSFSIVRTEVKPEAAGG